MSIIRIIEPEFMSAPCAGCDAELAPNNSPLFMEPTGSGAGTVYCQPCAVRELASELDRAGRRLHAVRFTDYRDNPEEGAARRALAAHEVHELQRALTRAECAE